MSANWACAGHRSALADAGVGGPTSPALDAHLSGCASCRAELAALRGLSRAIDEELRATLAVEPSPALLPRVRARVEAGRAGGGPFALSWVGWATGAFAVAMVALLATGPGRPGPATITPAQPIAEASAQEPVPGRARPQPTQAGTPARALVARAGASRATRGGAVGTPQVLVPPDEERALLLFVAALERRRAAPGSLLAGGADAPPLEDLTVDSISVEPLAINPLGRTE